MTDADTIIISDLHLGARNSRPIDVLRFLDEIDPHRLIINGDFFDLPQFGHLRQDELRLIEALRERARERSIQFVWGNHDPEPRFFHGLLGFEMHHEVLLEAETGTYLVYHGHGWDNSLSWPGWLVNSADWVYRMSQRVDPSHRLARGLKHRSKWFAQAVNELEAQAIQTARGRALAGVIAGHTHFLVDVQRDGVHYVNGGCWTERPMGYVRLRNGRVSARLWTPPTSVAFRRPHVAEL